MKLYYNTKSYLIPVLFITGFLLAATSCKKKLSANEIIEKSISVYGGDNYKQLDLKFVFREDTFNLVNSDSGYEYKKTITDSLGNQFFHVLNNNGFKVFQNKKPITLEEKKAKGLEGTLNSVAYFTLLPNGLQYDAVNKELLGEYPVDSYNYYVIKVTFDEIGGGEDFEDVYYYWIEKETFHIDFFAYTYKVNGGGVRVRKAFNRRIHNGILLQDYVNYKPNISNYDYENIYQALIGDTLTKVSEIKIKEFN